MGWFANVTTSLKNVFHLNTNVYIKKLDGGNIQCLGLKTLLQFLLSDERGQTSKYFSA